MYILFRASQRRTCGSNVCLPAAQNLDEKWLPGPLPETFRDLPGLRCFQHPVTESSYGAQLHVSGCPLTEPSYGDQLRSPLTLTGPLTQALVVRSYSTSGVPDSA